MYRNQPPTTDRDSDTRQRLAVVGLLLIGIVGAFVMPIWIASMVMALALAVLWQISRIEPAVEPVVIRRDSRR
jgi:hypothetical protein